MKRLIKSLVSVAFCLLCITLGTAGCNKKPAAKESTPKDTLGKFVYIDTDGVLHTKNGCKAVYKDHNEQEVRPYTVYSLSQDNLSRICSQCVTEKQLCVLIKLTSSNTHKDSGSSIDYDPDTEDPINDDFLSQ